MKKLLLVLVPSLLFLLSWCTVVFVLPDPYGRNFTSLLVLSTILALSWLAAWIKWNFGNMLLLVAGFLVPPVLLLVIEYYNSSWFQYFFTAFVTLYHFAPMALLAAIAAIIKKARSRK